MTFRFVDSLEGINPEQFAGDIFILPNGEAYKAEPGDQLGGFWSKLLGVAAPFAAMIPGAGAIVSPLLGAAAGALEAKEANKNAEANAKIQQYLANLDSVFSAISSGQISSSEALAQVKSSYESWADYKINLADEKQKGYLYQAELEVLLPKWKAIEGKAAEVAKTESVKAAQVAQQQNSLAFGLSFTEIAIAGVAVYFLFIRG